MLFPRSHTSICNYHCAQESCLFSSLCVHICRNKTDLWMFQLYSHKMACSKPPVLILLLLSNSTLTQAAVCKSLPHTNSSILDYFVHFWCSRLSSSSTAFYTPILRHNSSEQLGPQLGQKQRV